MGSQKSQGKNTVNKDHYVLKGRVYSVLFVNTLVLYDKNVP